MKGILVIDCGTTNLRVTLLDEDRHVLSTASAAGGVRHTAIDGNNDRLRAALRDCIGQALSKGGLTPKDVARCIAYGMITSNMGLLEIPHLCAPASVKDLRAGIQERVFEDIAPFPIAFIPGVRNFGGDVTHENFSEMDMMRGEETEAVGLHALLHPQGPAVFILPGSHNKFVSMGEGGEILGCMTSISGELLDAITHDTILADAVGHDFVSAQAYRSEMACEGAWECARSGLGRAAFAGRILATLGGERRAAVQSYLLGTVLAQDVQALQAFLPTRARPVETGSAILSFPSALGIAPDLSEPEDDILPAIYVAGKAPVQQAMIDVLEALGLEGAQAVEPSISAWMGLEGALKIAL